MALTNSIYDTDNILIYLRQQGLEGSQGKSNILRAVGSKHAAGTTDTRLGENKFFFKKKDTPR